MSVSIVGKDGTLVKAAQTGYSNADELTKSIQHISLLKEDITTVLNDTVTNEQVPGALMVNNVMTAAAKNANAYADSAAETAETNAKTHSDENLTTAKGYTDTQVGEAKKFAESAVTDKLDPHIADKSLHVTSDERTSWNDAVATVATKAPTASPALTGVPTAPTAAAGTNDTQIATTAFVAKAVSDGIAASDAMIYKGTIGTGGTITALPTTYNIGWTYRVVSDGTYAGQKCEVGDLISAIVARKGSGNANSDWTVAQTNIDGAITGVKGGTTITATQSGSEITVTHTTVTRKNDTSTAAPAHGGTFTAVKSVTSDAQGHVTGVDTETVTLPAQYSLPTAGSSLGGVKTTSTVSSTSGLTATPIINGIPYYQNTNTTYADIQVTVPTSGYSSNKVTITANSVRSTDNPIYSLVSGAVADYNKITDITTNDKSITVTVSAVPSASFVILLHSVQVR